MESCSLSVSYETKLAVNILVLCVMRLLSGLQGPTKILVFSTKSLPAERLLMYIGTSYYKRHRLPLVWDGGKNTARVVRR